MRSIDHDAIESILNRLPSKDRALLAGCLKARALKRPKATPANRVTLTVQTADGTALTFAIGRQRANVRVYGLDRKRPVALFAKQWLQILEASAELRDFINKHADRLKEKP